MKRARWVIAAAVLISATAVVVTRPDRALRTATGLTAHNLCAAVFTSHLDPESTFVELIKPMAGVASPFLHYRIESEPHAVEASVLGLFSSRAQFAQGAGCTLVIDPSRPAPQPLTVAPPAPLDAFAPATVVTTTVPAIADALDGVFAEHPDGPRKFVKAVVVVKNDVVVAERYAPGFDLHTPLLSYSVAKSFTNALLGIAVRQGRLQVDQPVGAPEWSAPGDPRAKLTLEDLLRMQSGLDAAETGSGFDPASQTLYSHDDMAAFCANHPLKEPPRTHFEYTSCDTLLLDRALKTVVGPGAAEMRAFADRELFTPAGLSEVTLEFDATGVLSGSAHVYAPARSYARFGLLYLHDGVTLDGTRVLPSGWAEFSRRSSLNSGYGAGFWTNDGSSPDVERRVALGLPKDAYFASGNRGQRIYIVPSQHLVVARFGYSEGPTFGFPDDMELVKTAIATLTSGHEKHGEPGTPETQ